MKTLALLVLGMVAMGCDYTVPLATTPMLDRDPAPLGLWQSTNDDGQTQSLLVLPLGTREYLVSYPSGTPDAMFARACLCQAGNQRLMQIEWIGTAAGKQPDDKRVYQYAACDVTAGQLSARLIDPGTTGRDPASAAELTNAIAEHATATNLFRKPLVFRKVER